MERVETRIIFCICRRKAFTNCLVDIAGVVLAAPNQKTVLYVFSYTTLNGCAKAMGYKQSRYEWMELSENGEKSNN